MAIRLTEEEVHLACTEIATQGERPTSLNLLDKLGRGSLTTITKYLTSWNASDDAQAIEAESLPAVVQLPSELSKEGEDLLKKMWNVAKNLTDTELEIQREALKQAEIANQLKVEEAFKFSEAQAMKIERLEEDFTSLENQLNTECMTHKQTENKLNNAEKTNVGLSKDNEQLQHEILELKNQLLALEETNKAVNQNKQALQENYSKEIKVKDDEIRVLEIDLGKVNEKFSSSVTTSNKLISDLKDKTKELSSSVVEIEKVNVRYESVTEELKMIKVDLKKANKVASDAEKRGAKLEGKLEVYKLLEQPNKVTQNS
jgi:chromosome segregation ATPase